MLLLSLQFFIFLHSLAMPCYKAKHVVIGFLILVVATPDVFLLDSLFLPI